MRELISGERVFGADPFRRRGFLGPTHFGERALGGRPEKKKLTQKLVECQIRKITNICMHLKLFVIYTIFNQKLLNIK